MFNLKTFLLFSLCSLSVSGVFAQKNLVKAQWADKAVQVDGSDAEWAIPLTYLDESSGMRFTVLNDNRKMYFCFQTSDPMTQIKMIRAGMTLTLSTHGAVKREAAVNFPLEELSDPTAAQPQQRGDQQQMRNRFLAGSTYLGTSGFTGKNGIQSIKDSLGLNAAINWDSANVMTYELSIPLSAFFGNNFSAQDLAEKITMTVEIHPLDKPGRNLADDDDGDSGGHMGRSGGFDDGSMGGGMGGRNGFGGGGGYGGGHHRGGGGQNAGSRAALFEKTSFERKLTLAVKA